jgi:hypothetical protein
VPPMVREFSTSTARLLWLLVEGSATFAPLLTKSVPRFCGAIPGPVGVGNVKTPPLTLSMSLRLMLENSRLAPLPGWAVWFKTSPVPLPEKIMDVALEYPIEAEIPDAATVAVLPLIVKILAPAGAITLRVLFPPCGAP